MMRPATFADFYGYGEGDAKDNNPGTDSIIRGNVEYGAKKFIKP